MLTSVNARLGYALPGKGELSLVGRFQDGHRGIPFATVFPDFDPNREQDDRLWLLSLEWRQPWTSIWEHRLRVGVVDETLEFKDQPDPAHPFGFDSDISTTRVEAEWYHFITPVPWNTITVGGEYRNETGEVKGSYDETIDSWAFVLQDQLRLFERLFLTGGVRYDGNSTFEDKATARVALSYLVKETDTRLKASWGQGFRAPTFNELFFPAFPPCPAFGNPDLRTEESQSWDGGVEQHLWARRVRLAATYFRNDFTDLIQSTLIDPVNFCFQAQNVGKARTEGVEVEASVAPIDGLVLALAYTYTDSEDRTTGDPLRRDRRERPRGDGHLGALARSHPLGRGAGHVEPVRGAGPAPEPRLHRGQRGGGVPPADQALGVPVERHAPRAGDEPLQRGLLRGRGLSRRSGRTSWPESAPPLTDGDRLATDGATQEATE